MKRRQFLRCVATAIGCVVPTLSQAQLPTGRPAPEFSLALFDGRVVSPKDFLGNPLLLNFFNSR